MMKELLDQQFETSILTQGDSVHIAMCLKRGGDKVAFADLCRESFAGGTPYIYLEQMRVEPQYRGQGLASSLIETVNRYLLDKHLFGFLFDAAHATSSIYDIHTRKLLDIQDFYSRHGWRYVTDCANNSFVEQYYKKRCVSEECCVHMFFNPGYDSAFEQRMVNMFIENMLQL